MEIRNRIAQFTEDGWRSQDYTLTNCQAYIQGTLFALPFAALSGTLYRVFLLERAVQLNHAVLILLAVLVVSLPLHELLHGFGWKVAGRLESYEIKFLFQHRWLMCVCNAVLPTKDYLAGVLLPFWILGGGSIAFLMIYPGTISVLTAIINLLLSGTDLLVAWKILRCEAVRIVHSPDRIGFVGLYFPKK